MNGAPLSGAVLGLALTAGLIAASLCLGFAALAVLLRLRNTRIAARWDRAHERWEEAVLDALAGDRDLSDLVRALTPRDVPYFLAFLSQFARRLRGSELEQLAVVARPLLPAIQRRLQARSPEARAAAADTLGLLDPTESAAALIARLDDPSPFVAMVAARALTRRRNAAHVARVVEHLHRFQQWRPGFLSAMLAALGPDAAPALRATIADARKPSRVRVVAADALAQLADPDAADPALAVAAATPDPELRAAMLRLLGRVGSGRHLPEVRRGLGSPDEPVRVAAARALVDLAEPADAEPLSRAFHDPSPWVAEHAARALALGSGRPVLQRFAAQAGERAVLAREILSEAPA